MSSDTPPLAACTVGIYTYGTLHRLNAGPRTQWEFDLSNFRDPRSSPLMKGKVNGLEEGVVEWITSDPRFPGIADICVLLVKDAFTHERMKWVSFSFRDPHGTLIAPAVGKAVADIITKKVGVGVFQSHLELGR